jgi:hypothetical protein
MPAFVEGDPPHGRDMAIFNIHQASGNSFTNQSLDGLSHAGAGLTRPNYKDPFELAEGVPPPSRGEDIVLNADLAEYGLRRVGCSK